MCFIPVCSLINLSKPLNLAVPPTTIKPFIIISADNSGGVFSRIFLILLIISFRTGLIAFKISSELMTIEEGKPVFRFCPFTSVSKFSSLG